MLIQLFVILLVFPKKNWIGYHSKSHLDSSRLDHSLIDCCSIFKLQRAILSETTHLQNIIYLIAELDHVLLWFLFF
ncbi:MAG: hypothetical protein BRC34_03865 [Cyanobacteria bacterium QH_1_48_107]|nr:MAG: hypothetical protein BRC34_03865 [Cyanobacteria bacterium QH_1_48_107]